MRLPFTASSSHAAVGVLAAAAVGVHCADAGTTVPAAERADSAGVEIVTSTGVDVPLHWTFTARFRIGGEEEGPGAFYNVGPGSVAVDARSRIVVVDRDNRRVVAFDSSGTPLWMAGGEGGGPGEFTYPAAVAVRGDTVDVTDSYRERELFHAADGRYLGTERLGRPATWLRPITGGDAFEHIASAADAASGRERILAVSRNADTIPIASVPHVEYTQVRYDDCDAVLLAQQVFAPSIVWTASGQRILANTEPGWVIDVYRGITLMQSLRRSVQPVPATAELAAREFRNDTTGGPCEMNTERLVSKVGFGELVPAVRAILATSDGTIWVRRDPPIDSLGTFDILSPEGEYLGTLTDVPAPIAFMPDGDVVGVEKDEMDVERVVVYDVVQ